MKRLSLIFLCLVPLHLFAQNITSAQQETLNNYILFGNEAKKTAAYTTESLISFYKEVDYFKTGKRYNPLAGYRCPIQLDNYYYSKSIKGTALAEPDLSNLKTLAGKLYKSLETLDRQCKELETYFTLQDYKTDQFKKYDSLVTLLSKTLATTKEAQQSLDAKVKKTYQKIHLSPSSDPYYAAESHMLKILAHEKQVLDAWAYNLNEKLPTGFPLDTLQKNISKTETLMAEFAKKNKGMGNYSQTVLNDFISGLQSYQDTKRKAVDDYNFEAKKSDKHSNDVYLSLINEYNGYLVATYNNFINLSIQHGYRGIRTIEYIATIEYRDRILQPESSAAPYTDLPYIPLTLSPQTVSLTMAQHKALTNYVTYINESLQQTEHMRLILSNFNSSAVYYKDLTTFKGKGQLSFDPSDFKIPKSSYQTLQEENIHIPAQYRKSLSTQAEVLASILKEMEGLGIELNKQAAGKLYEQDNVGRVYEILERFNLLLKTFDEKKERLYNDVRKIYESYKIKEPSSSWNISAKELLLLLDLNKEALFISKKYFEGDSASVPVTEKIDAQIRKVIANEYSNLKGIEKYGRYNGLCPYSPYEDLPNNSRTFSENLKKISTSKVKDKYSYSHPYHSLAYLYNSFVDDYNKFCELSKVPLLRTIHEPELFYVRYPDQQVRDHNAQSEKIRLENERIRNERLSEKQSHTVHPPVETKVVHDTVYIERNSMDTLYLKEGSDHRFSMEGYATNNLVLLLDVSGSMNDPEKLPLMKKSLARLLTIMRKEDELSIVTYAGEAQLALAPTSCKEADKIIKVIESLKSEGTTNGNAGIRLAYKIADANYIRGGNNRIILATDGEFPVNKDALKQIEKYAGQELFLSVFYYGNHESASEQLKELAKKGKGNFEAVHPENSDLKLLKEVKAKKK